MLAALSAAGDIILIHAQCVHEATLLMDLLKACDAIADVCVHTRNELSGDAQLALELAQVYTACMQGLSSINAIDVIHEHFRLLSSGISKLFDLCGGGFLSDSESVSMLLL